MPAAGLAGHEAEGNSQAHSPKCACCCLSRTQAPSTSHVPADGLRSQTRPHSQHPSHNLASGQSGTQVAGSSLTDTRAVFLLPAHGSTQTRRTSGRGNSGLPLNGDGNWESSLRPGRKSKSLLSSRRAQRRTWGTAGCPVSPRSLERGRSNSSWKPFPDK